MRRKHILTAVFLAIGILGLAACGNTMEDMEGMESSSAEDAESSAEEVQNADFNDADIRFASDMIPHHRQAVEMAQLAEARAKDPRVLELAMTIQGAQDPEIAQMSAWLKAWGEPVPQPMRGMDMSESMAGMMSLVEMDELTNSEGVKFDTMFLTMMIQHHEGAIEMAQAEAADGQNADAIALAKKIVEAQADEITRMRALLN